MAFAVNNSARSFYNFSEGVAHIQEVIGSSPFDWKIVDGKLERTGLSPLEKTLTKIQDIILYLFLRISKGRFGEDRREVRLKHIEEIFDCLGLTFDLINKEWANIKPNINTQNAPLFLSILNRLGQVVSQGYFATEKCNPSEIGLRFNCNRISLLQAVCLQGGIVCDGTLGHTFFYREQNLGIYKLDPELRTISSACHVLKTGETAKTLFSLQSYNGTLSIMHQQFPSLLDAIIDLGPEKYLLELNRYRILFPEKHDEVTPKNLKPLIEHVTRKYEIFKHIINKYGDKAKEDGNQMEMVRNVALLGDALDEVI
jgi:hypothetical protein